MSSRTGIGPKFLSIALGSLACVLLIAAAAQARKPHHLHVGQRCSNGLEQLYLRHRLHCAHGRLRHASLAVQRQGEPLLLDKHGRLSPGNALEAFSATVAHLPGVKVRKGAVGSLDDATMIIAAVEAERKRLTAAQRRAVDKALKPKPTSGKAGTPADLQAFQAYANEAETHIQQHGFSFTHPIEVVFGEPVVSDELAHAQAGWLWDVPGYDNACVITVTDAGVALLPADRRWAMAHEVFHCAQFEFYNSPEAVTRVPAWVTEGSAAWVGDVIAKETNGFELQDNFWNTWLQAPEPDLGRRAYNAVGFYALLAQSGVDVFSRLKEILPAAASGGDNSAYGVATAGVPQYFFDTWGPGFVRIPDLGANWNLSGIGILPRKEVPHWNVNFGTEFNEITDPRGASAKSLGLEADVIEVQTNASHGLLHTSDGTQTPVHTEVLCTESSGCKCDNGALKARQVPKGIAFIGWQGGDVSITGDSLEQECKKQHEEDPPPPPPASPSCKALHRAGVENVVPGGGYVTVDTLCEYGLCEQHFTQGEQTNCAYGRGATLTINHFGSRRQARGGVKQFKPPAYKPINIGADIARIARIRHPGRDSGYDVVMAKGKAAAHFFLGASADEGSPVEPIWRNRPQAVRMAKRIAKQL